MPDRPEIVLVRHGETDWALNGRHTGRTDVALNATGVEQARRLGERLGGWSFAAVLTSPLARAVETCRLAGYGDAAGLRDDLMEWDYGDYEGLTAAQIREHVPGWTIWNNGAPHGETATDVGRRAHRVIDEALAADGDVVLFGHGHALRVLASCWLGLPAGGGRYLALDTASVGLLGHERETRVIRRWNTTDGVRR